MKYQNQILLTVISFLILNGLPATLLLGDGGNKPKAQSISDLQKLLVIGMHSKEITNVFGAPRWVDEQDKGVKIWDCAVPAFAADGNMRGSYVVGITLKLTNDHLAKWDCIYFGTPEFNSSTSVVLHEQKNKTNAPTIKFFVVNPTLIDNGKFIDTKRFPKLGFISQEPNISIQKVKNIRVDENLFPDSNGLNQTNWTFTFSLAPSDAEKFKLLTAANTSKKLLIMIDDEPVFAATIRFPIENGFFAIDFKDRNSMETTKKKLEHMER